eukprot:TRINITY_DN20587_c0_g1_i1.p1 TRINITY_DN20587_c0_g1~~TRINITY_DN20587_c0_g1_i1.p1  ORF type:complete len:263 (+),score=60.05 TRINITY_DN20587_c0_g1_i1:190-978(+)
MEPTNGDDPYSNWELEKPKIIQLYRKAHASRSLDLEKKATALDRKASRTATGDSAVDCEATATHVREVKDKSDFEDWYQEDKELFRRMDADSNGFLEQAEFREFAVQAFSMTEVEAVGAFSKWDIDAGGSVGPFEFVTLMSFWHTEKAYREAMARSDVELEARVPCECCAPHAMQFAVCCSLCTAGLSWIPMCCIISGTMTSIKKAAEKVEEHEKAQDKAFQEARVKAKERILKGPPEGILSKGQCAQLTVAVGAKHESDQV